MKYADITRYLTGHREPACQEVEEGTIVPSDYIPSADEVHDAIIEALNMNENMRLYGTIDKPADTDVKEKK